MALAGVFIVMAVAFLAIDAVALKFVMYPLFERHLDGMLREAPRLGVAAAFYVVYVGGIVFFAVLPALAAGRVGTALLNGAVLGLLAYGTFEASAMATLRGWSWQLVATDVLWGVLLTALVAALGYAAGRALL